MNNEDLPNRATIIACAYFEERGMTGNISSLKKHVKMLSKETSSRHSFVGNCVTEIVDNINWDFVVSKKL